MPVVQKRVPLTLWEPGVFKVRGKVLDANAYYVVTRDPQTNRLKLHDGRVHIVSEHEDDVDLVARLRRERRAIEAVPPPTRHLQLVPRRVRAAVDGPSPSHPALLEERDVGEQLREALAVSASLRISAGIYGNDALTQDVASRLERALARPA